jgi:integrase
MKLTKDPESGVYHVKFTGTDGRSHSRSTKSSNLEEAKRIVEQAKVAELEAAAKAGALNAESLMAIMASRKVDCAGAVEEWAAWRIKASEPATVRTQRLCLGAMLAQFSAAKWPVTKLTFDHLDEYVNNKDGTGRSNRDTRIAALRSFFGFLTARAYRVDDPSKLVRVRMKDLTHEQKETKKRVPFTEKEFNRIMDNTEGFFRWATALSYYAGLRLSDVACLEWSSLLPEEIIVWTRKGETRVALPIDDPLIGGGKLRMIFFEIMEHSRHPLYVFPEEREVMTDPEKRSRLSVYYGRILTKLNIEGKSFHCLRHAFATRLAKAGKTMEEIGRAIGHSKASTRSGVTAGYVTKG